MAGPFQKVQTDELCCYGCGLQAQYVMKSPVPNAPSPLMVGATPGSAGSPTLSELKSALSLDKRVITCYNSNQR